MPSSNPALNDAIFTRESEAAGTGRFDPAWGSPATELPPGLFDPASGTGTGTVPPTSPGANGPQGTPNDVMRISGTMSATAVLLGFLLVAAWFGWQSVTVTTTINEAGQKIVNADPPAWLFLALIGAMGVAFLTIFKPKLARFTGPVYAVLEGLLLGGISHLFDAQYNGIVLSAVSVTIGVFVVMLGLYTTRVIKVTEKLRMAIVASTLAICLVYVVSLVLSLFGMSVPMIHDSGPVGIIFSLVVVGIASFNLLLDFDFIERGVQMQAPRYMEWYGAFGLILTLVWLYIEVLRLLAKLRNN